MTFAERFLHTPLLLFAAITLAFSGCTKAKLNNAKKSGQVLAVQKLETLKINSVTPPQGPVAGGTQITISGEGFFPGVELLIDQKPCENLQVISATLMTCVTPATTSEKLVDLVAGVFGGTPQVLANAFRYIQPLLPTGGFAVTNGGGVASGTGMIMMSTIGEVSIPAVSTGAGISLVSGVQATINR
ncbi:MAG: IPT/TIG domain-containing protein [Oligoflexia bacterium]|nr:IPT/TIG domain-containing protein [Oligoflexia bacterium]